jgi:hypothetical protein
MTTRITVRGWYPSNVRLPVCKALRQCLAEDIGTDPREQGAAAAGAPQDCPRSPSVKTWMLPCFIRGVSCGGRRDVSPGVGGSQSGSAVGASKLMLSKRYDLDNSSSSSLNLGSGGWSDGNLMPEEGAPLAKPDEDGVAPLALFGEELAILEGFWPGSHNVTLLSRFVTVPLTGLTFNPWSTPPRRSILGTGWGSNQVQDLLQRFLGVWIPVSGWVLAVPQLEALSLICVIKQDRTGLCSIVAHAQVSARYPHHVSGGAHLQSLEGCGRASNGGQHCSSSHAGIRQISLC